MTNSPAPMIYLQCIDPRQTVLGLLEAHKAQPGQHAFPLSRPCNALPTLYYRTILCFSVLFDGYKARSPVIIIGHVEVGGIPVEIRDMAAKIGFEIGCRPFQLFYTAYDKWKSDFKPAFNSPGSAKATMDMFSTLYEMGFRERDLLDQQQVNRFKESVKPKIVHVVPPNFINGLEAAVEAVANPNPRKRKNCWDSQEGDGDDGERDGTKDASGSGTSQGVQRAKRYILEKLYKFFDPVLKDFNPASKIYSEVPSLTLSCPLCRVI
ncbi:hypothetical protein VOLCADRAFT_106607 [Volvox carteri f. nagariensis]|uniref:Uncharacterized protein n=1 Tax=Volvox carteri f. nagariensis TaxID=3068 RepID=D8U8J4_VOLCA|nr:uncharacterized protein VOLCADRAFT_106607 [Volvox carteri f. nagariensis]EFJ43934.1 hypothetical protein VOLCADRAFT_106607 [Volvox carteri f. nagariensis]|eukprot:XP_002954946.1 hypothetical protein VOLCADRAFT_106607 [Volvox carteri f. nagariensis]